MPPRSRIQATAADVSSPPEKAIPMRSPTGMELSTLDIARIRSDLQTVDRRAGYAAGARLMQPTV